MKVSAPSLSRYVCLICRNPIPHAGAECPHCRSRATAVVGATPSLLAAVFVAMALLIVFTFRLDREFDAERIERGRLNYQLAAAASAVRDYPQAIEYYREALLHIRNDLSYRRGLAVALYQDGRYQEAETQLLSLRTADPTDAVVNRLLARTAARDGRVEEAVNYYRTAVYGRWPSDTEANHRETRFELIDLLETLPGRRAVNELASMAQEEPDDPELMRRIAERLLANGAPDEALPVLEGVQEMGVSDAELDADLAWAQFGVNEFDAAHDSVERALRKGLEDQGLADLGELLHDVMALDPTQPRIRTSERLRRSRALLERATAYIERCAGTPPEDFVGPMPAPALAVSSTLARARQLLEDQRPEDSGEAVEARMMTATNLWALREQVCTSVWDEDDPLRLVMRRLSS